MPIADPGFEQSAITGLRTGQAVSTTNPLGVFIQSVMEKIRPIQEAQLQHVLQMKYNPEYRFKSKLFEMAGNQFGQESGQGIDSNEFMRSFLGLPKSLERVKAESEAEQTGKNLAPLSPMQQEESLLRQQQIRKTKQDIARTGAGFLARHFGGVQVPGEERIRVRRKTTGESGTIFSKDFNAEEYDRL